MDSIRNTSLADRYYRIIEKHVLPFIERHRFTPNQFSLLGLAVALCVPLGCSLHPVLGLIFMGASGMADTLDGMVARRSGRSSVYGAFLDSSLDRVSDFFYLMGFWLLFWREEFLLLSSTLIFTSLLLTMMISYVKAKAESLRATCSKGLMERGFRIVYLLIWLLLVSLLPSGRRLILWAGLSAYLLLTGLTVLQRISSIRPQLNGANPPPPA